MKYCTNCGTQLSDDAKFCSVCGTKQEAVKTAEPKKPAAPKKPASAPKKPAAPPKQETNTQAKRLEGQQEEFFTASETAGEVVLSSWENPNPKPKANPGPQNSAYSTTAEPNKTYQQSANQYRDNTGQQQQYYQQQAAPPRQQSAAQPPRQQATRQQAPPSYQQRVAPPQKKKRGFFSWVLIILMILIVLYFLGSILGGCKNVNLPPDPGTPEPAAHEGVFVCGSDTLFFNGDGKTVSWHFADGSTGSGTYTFIFGHGMARYDVAERLVLSDMTKQASYTFVLAKPASDTIIQIVSDGIADFKKVR
ncbi:MAG: zinc ribbon domain-containing protein [Bacteroidales bacterium]|nr:zinc ribbon domain-containing protein [Bacteroidales bacterium]